MRNIIYAIIQKHYGESGQITTTSGEIADLIIKFIDWLAKEVSLKIVWHDGFGYVKEWHYLPLGWHLKQRIGKNWSLDELFEYWYNEIYIKND